MVFLSTFLWWGSISTSFILYIRHAIVQNAGQINVGGQQKNVVAAGGEK